MMDDEPWVIEDPSESVPEEVPAEVAPADAAPAEEAPAAEAEPEPVSVNDRATKKLVFKHWVRPKFLQYNYLYEYRHNYYDDVIDYLDRRQKGVDREKPRAQTWAERAMRTSAHRQPMSMVSQASRSDHHLMSHVSSAARFQRYHSKSLISRKYQSLGFSTVNVIV